MVHHQLQQDIEWIKQAFDKAKKRQKDQGFKRMVIPDAVKRKTVRTYLQSKMDKGTFCKATGCPAHNLYNWVIANPIPFVKERNEFLKSRAPELQKQKEEFRKAIAAAKPTDYTLIDHQTGIELRPGVVRYNYFDDHIGDILRFVFGAITGAVWTAAYLLYWS